MRNELVQVVQSRGQGVQFCVSLLCLISDGSDFFQQVCRLLLFTTLETYHGKEHEVISGFPIEIRSIQLLRTGQCCEGVFVFPGTVYFRARYWAAPSVFRYSPQSGLSVLASTAISSAV